MRTMPTFIPQLTQSEAVWLSSQYPAAEDSKPLAAGRAISEGDVSRGNLQIIVRWKTNDRGKSRLAQNSDLEVRDALRLAVSAQTPRAAIAVLTGLSGVDTPVASAVMTAISPEKYTVLDFRALEALGNPTRNRSVLFYVAYLNFCVGLASRWRMSLRELDRGLWQWSATRAEQVRKDADPSGEGEPSHRVAGHRAVRRAPPRRKGGP
jgi:hypothetical protein